MSPIELDRNYPVVRKVFENITQPQDDAFVINLNEFQTFDLPVGQLPGIDIRVCRFVLRPEIRVQIK